MSSSAIGAAPAAARPSRPAFILRYIVLPATIGASIACAILFVPAAGWTVHDVTTGSSQAYPDLQPRDYDAAPGTATQVAAASASTLNGWKVTRTDVASGIVKIEAPAPLPIFTDDLTATVTPTGSNHDSSHVVIRSRSRVGIGDLGANAAHIRALQAVMDDKLPRLER